MAQLHARIPGEDWVAGPVRRCEEGTQACDPAIVQWVEICAAGRSFVPSCCPLLCVDHGGLSNLQGFDEVAEAQGSKRICDDGCARVHARVVVPDWMGIAGMCSSV